MKSHKSIHQQKVLIGTLVGSVVIILVLGFFGLPLLVNLGIWFNATFGEQTAAEQAEENFFGTLYVDAPPPATNAAELEISGNTANFETVEIILNDAVAQEIDVTDQDEFTETISGLIVGENAIQIIARAGDESKESDRFTVSYLNTPPEMTIDEPADGTTTTDEQIMIRGTTDAANTIEIDGAPVIVTAAGTFEDEIRLRDDENVIEIVARDEAGNETKQELTITRGSDDSEDEE